MLLCLEKSWVAVISSLGKIISLVARPGRACRKSWGTVLSCLEKITAMAHRITLSALESITGGVSPRKIPARSKLLCHIFPDLFFFFPTLGCGVDIFYSIPRNKILETNLPRLLGVDVRCHTSGLQKNNLPVVCR